MKKQPEHIEQVALFRWAALVRNTYPMLDLMYAIPNGGHRSITTAVALKAEGVKKGVPDIFLAYPVGKMCGMFIEMKAGKNKTTPEQKEWLKALESVGYYCVVCYSFEEAKEAILGYIDSFRGMI